MIRIGVNINNPDLMFVAYCACCFFSLVKSMICIKNAVLVSDRKVLFNYKLFAVLVFFLI